MHHGALEAEPGHRALQFVGGGLRIGGRQRGEAGEAVGMGAHRLVQPVVGAPCQAYRASASILLHRRRPVRDHLHVDAGLVHLLDPEFAEVLEPLDELRRPVGIERPI